jgi:mannose-1-phosphate guanylyltransferase
LPPNDEHGDAHLAYSRTHDIRNVLVHASSRLVSKFGGRGDLIVIKIPDAVLVTDKERS